MKSHALPFNNSSSHSSAPLQLVHTDLWGPSPILSSFDFRYYVVFVDEFSRYTWLYPFKYKSNVYSIFITFQKLVENLFKTRIKSIQSDWGGEFQSLHKYFS